MHVFRTIVFPRPRLPRLPQPLRPPNVFQARFQYTLRTMPHERPESARGSTWQFTGLAFGAGLVGGWAVKGWALTSEEGWLLPRLENMDLYDDSFFVSQFP